MKHFRSLLSRLSGVRISRTDVCGTEPPLENAHFVVRHYVPLMAEG